MQFLDWFIFMNWLPIIITVIVIAGIILGVIVKVYITRFGHKVLVFDENTIEVFKAKKTDDLIKFRGKTVTKRFTGRLMKSGLSTNRVYLLEEGSLMTTDFYPTIKHLYDDYEFEPVLDENGKPTVNDDGQEIVTLIRNPKKQDTEQAEDLDDSSKQQIIESGVLDRFLAIFKNVGFSWQTFLFGLFVGLAVALLAVEFGVF